MELKWLHVVSTLCLCVQISPQDRFGPQPVAKPQVQSRILGGRVAAVSAWPWQVSIQSRSKHFCSGTILSPVWVLSATHCFKLMPRIRRVHVVAGLNELSAPGVHAQIRSVLKVKLHERYNKTGHNNDVALVRLSSPFHFSNHVKPACVPHNLTHELALDFSHCFISGWGKTSYLVPSLWTDIRRTVFSSPQRVTQEFSENNCVLMGPVLQGRMSDRLQEAEVKLIDRSKCNTTWYRGLITDNMLCAGLESGAADSCQGDSGGPLQCYSQDEERFYVVGVTSFGEKCGMARRGGVYARTSRFSDWLRTSQVTAAAAASGAAPRLNTRLIVALMLLWNILTDCGSHH